MVECQAKRSAEEAASVLTHSRAGKAKKPSPLRAAGILPTTKASQTSIAKMQTAKQLPLAGRTVQEAIVRTAVAEIAAVVAAGTAEVVGVQEAIVGLVAAVVIAGTARVKLS